MTETKPKRTRKRKVTFNSGVEGDAGANETYSTDFLVDSLKKVLSKSVDTKGIDKTLQKKYDRSKVAYSSREYSGSAGGVDERGWRRLSDIEQKELAQVDPYISAIISTRCSQGSVVSRRSDSKYDKGTRVLEVKPLNAADFDSLDEFQQAQDSRKQQMSTILKWFQTCGNPDRDVLNAVFAGADILFKQCSLSDYISAQIRNLLTFGRIGAQIFRNEDGIPALFRPVPIETIYHGDPDSQVHLSTREESCEQSQEDADEFNSIVDRDDRPHYYIQKIDGQNVNFYTEDDLKVWYFQKQALFDLRGYPLSPIEQAIYMVFVHQQTLGYLRNQFIKGIATKGILTIESLDPAAQLSDEDVENIRRDFHNFVNRNDNSAATPVISGPVKVGFVTLSPAPNDMGFLQIEEHVVRALCSAFQISPQEMGYGHLSIGQGGLTQANKQEEIIRGEERGLRIVLDIIYDGLNEILYENFPEAKDKYRLVYTGVGEDTRDAAINRQAAELNTTATMSSLWADSEKSEPIPFGGNVPLASAFHANVVRYMLYGTFMELFYGIEGASKKKEYDFIIDPQLNAAYQQLKTLPPEMAHKQSELQLEQMAAQTAQMEQAQQMQAQQMQAGMAQGGQGDAQGQPGEQEAPPEQAQKSLMSVWSEKNKLNKSVSLYFREWIRAHENN